MELGEINVQVMKGYEELVNEQYKQPVNGLFVNVTASVLKAPVSDNSESDVGVNIEK